MLKRLQTIQLHLATLLMALVLAGCSTVKLAGDYDEQIDTGTTALQRDFERFLVKLERSATSPGDTVAPYAENSAFYAEARVSISSLRLRAVGLITEERARQHITFQNNSRESVLLAAEGLNQLLVEETLNAALKAVRTTVNQAAGFALL